MSSSLNRIGRLCCLAFCLLSVGLPPSLARAAVMGFGEVSVGKEREVGEQLLAVVRRQFKLVDDPDVVQYIRKLGASVVQKAGPQFFDYHFFVINDKQVNAFAAPSGLIFFYTGLIKLMDNENELVAVMAHETAHIVRRHFAQQMEKSAKVGIGAMALLLAGLAIGAGPISEAMITGSTAASASMQLKFSRQDEEEADRSGFKWMEEMGRNPAAMADMLGELRRIEQISGSDIPPYLQTHPEPGRRMGYVQDLLLQAGKHTYKTIDEFPFHRIKTRLMVLTGSPDSLMPYYREKVASAKADDPKAAMARYGLALSYEAIADFDHAEAEMRQVIAVFPDRPMLRVDLGVIFFEAGRYAEALPLFQDVADQDPNNGYAGFYLARTLEQLGRRVEAGVQYEKILPLLPDYPKLVYRLGAIKAGEKKVSESYYYLGDYYWLAGDMKLAKRNLKKSITEAKAEEKATKEKAENLLERIEKIEKNNK